ncbi:RNA-binding ATPase activator esf2 [Rachicladosporium monterosium]|uniref:18S rRNA factor 2 n=1 Tax=Rachicladosporium monterosium TaxID=1507873 RepID=A0ABR0L8K6_9PEZI|nr:RNA-binding ATPase activator esf2 [Rachicladosporium monterosium]
MSIRKRNEFLEHGGSDDEGLGNESEDEERRGAKGGRTNKRRKIDAESDDESVHSVNERQEAGVAVLEDHDGEPIDGTTTSAGRFALGADFEEHEQPQSTLDPTAAQTRPKSVLAVARKSGVLYISRIPPFMKPSTLRHFLLPHASKGLGRVFLTPETQTSHSARVKRGGNKKKSFTDGWVEFTSKTEAKAVAERLNGEILGGKKGGFYRDDMWNVKYLRGFKWTHLTEQIANENAERVARLREEVRRTRKENKAFVEDVERGKMVEGMVRKRMAKDEGKVAVSGTGGRQFLQRKARERNGDEGTERGTGKEVAEQRRVVGKIFA